MEIIETIFSCLYHSACRGVARRRGQTASRVSRRSPLHPHGLEALEGRLALAFVGPEAPVNVKIENNQYEAATASSYTGRSVIILTDVKGGGDTDIRARLCDANGAPIGMDIVVNNSINVDSAPAVAMDASGEFVVTWTRTSGGNHDIRAARFTSTGVNLGGFGFSFPVAATPLPESESSVAVDATGAFVVSYTVDTNSTNQDIRARSFTADGILIEEIGVATSMSAQEARSSVARILDGRFSIAYEKRDAAGTSNILLSRYSAGGDLLGNHMVAGTADPERDPSVSMNESGHGVVAYQRHQGGNNNIKAKRFTAGGGISPEINIRGTGLDENSPSVAMQRYGYKFVVAYNEVGFVFGVGVSEVSGTDAVTTLPSGPSRFQPAVSIDGLSNYQVAYETRAPLSDGSGSGVRRRRGVL